MGSYVPDPLREGVRGKPLGLVTGELPGCSTTERERLCDVIATSELAFDRTLAAVH